MIVTLTPRTDFFPVPRVEIRLEPLVTYSGGDAGSTGPGVLSGGTAGSTGATVMGGDASTTPVELPLGTDAVTLWWRSQGRTDRVRGVIGRFFTGAGGFLDMEAGLNVATSYELECFAEGVAVGRVPLGTVTLLADGDQSEVLIQQPLDPSINANILNLSGSLSSMTFNADGEVVSTEGSSKPTLVSGGRRQTASGVPVSFAVRSDLEAARVLAVLGTESRPQPPVWLMRAKQGIVPRRLFTHVASLVQMDIDHSSGGEWSGFQATVREVAPPVPGLVVSPLSYTDLDVSFASYTEMDAAFPTYDERDSAWEYAGASGGF